MPRHERPNPETDPFRPPAIPTEVCCLHCGREYESYLIHWQEELDEQGEVHGFWCCPTPGCDGKGFGFDIFPTDPEYRGEDGEPVWFLDDGEDEEDLEPDEDDGSMEAVDAEELLLGGELLDLDLPAPPEPSTPPEDDAHDEGEPGPRRRGLREDEDDLPF